MAVETDIRLHSVLWVQTSAEYANSTRQVFRMARDRLADTLADDDINAIPGVAGTEDLPPAIIVDVDETILDNSPHAARAILAGRGFHVESWRAWVNEAAAPPLPGAVSYLQDVQAAGIKVFYVTNRHQDLHDATRRNLATLGCPLDEPGDGAHDVMLMRQGQPDWTADKTTRRVWVAQRYRVVQMLGDDLADFVAVPPKATIEYRHRLANRHGERWGHTWFQLPNPVYGSWERAITPDGRTILESPLQDKFELLETE